MRKLTLLWLGPALLLAGCGGGGAGLGSITITSDWSSASVVGGASERVQLLSPTGAVISSVVVNAPSAGTTTSSVFPNLASGSYPLQVQLFSQADAQGTEIGDVDSYVSPSNTPFKIAVGGTATTLQVTPQSSTLAIQSTQQFYATAMTSANSATFIPLNGTAWSVLGNVGTIDANSGIFTATTAGSGSVRATINSGAIIGAAQVTVQQTSIQHGTWTVMVYMNAANDLSQYSILNVNQLESVANTGSATRVLVQWKQVPSLGFPTQFNGTRRYLIQPDNSSGIGSKLIQDLGVGVDMGSPQTLNDFINWCATYYPADHYALVVWNHGNGWNRGEYAAAPTRAVSYDDEFGTAIQTWQLSQAIGSTHFDIIAWDASLMQMCEVADEIRDKSTYIVGSEESPPGAGYPYDLIFSKFYSNPADSTLDLAKGFVDQTLQAYATDSTAKITQSILDPTQLPALDVAVQGLEQALVANRSTIASTVQAARNNAQTYSQSGTRYYRDLYDLTLQLDANGAPSAVQTADSAVRQAVLNAVVYQGHNSLSPNSHGISIDFSPASVFASEASDYNQLRFENDSLWGTWLGIAP